MADMGSKYDICGMKKARKSNFSPEEVDALVSTVGKNYQILYGEFAKRAANKQARHKVWLDVTKQVNRVSLERRTLQEVKNKWKKCQHLYKERDSPDDLVLPNVWGPLTSLKDSMPLEQRLKVPPDQEPILQSQPLSPTKLKVTRQSTKPPQPSPKPPTPEPPNEEVCLRWNSHHSNMQSSFPSLLLKEQYVDATLVAEGQSLKCHRLILSSCSPYFEEVLSGISPFQHPVLFMKDIPFWVLKSLCDFMYAGEVHIFQNKLEELLAVAETLKIKGLAGKLDGSNEEAKPMETVKPVKEEKKEEKEKEVKEKKRLFSFEATPKTTTKTVRSVYTSRKSEKTGKEPTNNKGLNKQGILDPLDLLEPVYEEVTKASAPPKVKELKTIPMKKGKLKKRKFSEEREESPPPLFLSRKGTRSRPNVKIPKYYHTHYERVNESTIVREPHTDQADPLFQLEEIKSEPLDVVDDVIEIEDNVIGFSNVSELTIHDEEIIGNYDSPLVNLNDKAGKEEEPISFKKISLVPQPIIMNIHSVADKTPSTVKIVDVKQIKGPSEKPSKSDDQLETSVIEDPLNITDDSSQKGTESITITNVHSIAEMEEKERKTSEKTVEETPKEQQIEEEQEEIILNQTNDDFHIENLPNVDKSPKPVDIVEITAMDINEDKENEEMSVTEEIPNPEALEDKENEETRVTEEIPNPETLEDKENEETSFMEEVPNPETLEDKENEETSFMEEVPNPETLEDKENEETSLMEEIPNSETIQEEIEPEKEHHNTSITKEEDEVTRAEHEKEEIFRDEDGNPVELGFHIAKVASEQFSTPEQGTNNVNEVISEDCANELGFQITNVVSAQTDSEQVPSELDAPKDKSDSDLGTFSNHLEEVVSETPEERDSSAEIKSVLPISAESLCEETQFLAESLEKLLDK